MQDPKKNIDPDQLRAFFESAPPEIRAWAMEQLAKEENTPELAAAPAAAASGAVGIEAFEDEEDQVATRTRAPKQKAAAGAGRGLIGKINLVLVALLVAAVIIIVQQWNNKPEPSQMENPHAGQDMSQVSQWEKLDEKAVADLKKQLETKPTDVETLKKLGDLYSNAGMFDQALEYQEKILALQPEKVDALLAAGVSNFSLDKFDAAERYWVKASELAPKTPEPWFNLGFLYMSVDPPQADKAIAAWEKVTKIAPGSDIAKAAQGHIDGVAKKQNSGSVKQK